jgi:hypothetical protein
MKKILTLSTLLGLLGAIPLQAAQKDIYITGSTAFRANTYNAIKALYGGGFGSEWPNPGASGNSQWTMTGSMGIFPGDTVTVHANFTGSVQGIYSLYNHSDTKVYFAGTADATLTTNTATVALSDVDSISTSYPLDPASYRELYVAIQPFLWVRNTAASTSITNVSFQQLQSFMPLGKIKLSYFTGDIVNDSSKNIWLVNRSLDSGTRVTAYADSYVSGSPIVYYWNTNAALYGGKTNQFVVATNYLGPALFSYGYVGGGDVVNAMNLATTNAMAYLGISDSKNVNGGQNVLAYDGAYPSSDIKTGSAIPAAPSFDYVRNGQYSFWAYECLDYPKNTSYTGQNISAADLDTFCRSLGGYDSSYNFVPDSAGSIDHQINLGATKVAIRLGDMNVSRSAVGGPIAP